jgi:hypothetical protein
MCYNCGCLLPNDPMGSDDNITNRTFEHIAKEQGKSLRNIQKDVYNMLKVNKITNKHVDEMLLKATKVWGQSLEEAKKNTMELLKHELKKDNG